MAQSVLTPESATLRSVISLCRNGRQVARARILVESAVATCGPCLRRVPSLAQASNTIVVAELLVQIILKLVDTLRAVIHTHTIVETVVSVRVFVGIDSTGLS